MSEFFLGCDVSKGYADFIVLDRQGKIVEKVFQFDDTTQGHSALSRFITDFFARNKQCTLCAGVESTGGYESNWYALLTKLSKEHTGMKAARVNPLAVKKHHEASMRRNITDGISAYNIASYLIAYPNQVRYEQEVTYSGLQTQWNFIQQLQGQRTQLINSLGFLVYQSHPELVRFCKKGIAAWLLELLCQYPTAADLARAKAVKVAKIPFIDLQKATELIADARQSVAAHASHFEGKVITAMATQIKSLEEMIAVQKALLCENASLPAVELLCTFKGISTYSAVGLLLNIVSVERFPTVKHLVSYFGLHPVYFQSGDGSSGFHMSKRGRKQPRAILFMVALSAITCNPTIKRIYAECLDKKMEKMAAIGVCMHKILRIIYGMLKNNKVFDPVVDETNRIKPKHIASGKRIILKKRRYQSHDAKAPISGRQSNSRRIKEGTNTPQKKVILINGVMPALQKENINGSIENQKSNRATLVVIQEILKEVLGEEAFPINIHK